MRCISQTRQPTQQQRQPHARRKMSARVRPSLCSDHAHTTRPCNCVHCLPRVRCCTGLITGRRRDPGRRCERLRCRYNLRLVFQGRRAWKGLIPLARILQHEQSRASERAARQAPTPQRSVRLGGAQRGESLPSAWRAPCRFSSRYRTGCTCVSTCARFAGALS